MVNIVFIADAIFQTDKVGDGGNDVINRQMEWQKLETLFMQPFGQALFTFALFELRDNLIKDGSVDKLLDIQSLGIDILQLFFAEKAQEISAQIHPVIARHLEHFVGSGHLVADGRDGVNPHIVDTGILDVLRQFAIQHCALGGQDFAFGIHHVFGQAVPRQTAGQAELFVDLIDADSGEVITLRLKKHVFQIGTGAFGRINFTRTQFAEHLLRTVLLVVAAVLFDREAHALFIAEKFVDLFIAAKAQSAQENTQIKFTRAIHTNPEHAVGIGFVLQPGAAVRNQLRGIKFNIIFIFDDVVVSPRRTDDLGNDDALRPVDDKSTGVRHDREITDKNHLLLDDIRPAVVETNFDAQRRSIVLIPLFALGDTVVWMLYVKLFIQKR